MDFNIVHLFSPPRHPQSNGQAEKMVGTLKRAMDVNTSSQLETELNQFIYAYNYTPCDAAPDHKSPAEGFFGRKLRTPLEIFSPAPEPNESLTDRQKKMKHQFDSHHGTKSRQFVSGQTVVVQFANGRRASGKFVRKVGRTIAHVRVGNKLITRHFNQIWNRAVAPRNQQQAITSICYHRANFQRQLKPKSRLLRIPYRRDLEESIPATLILQRRRR